MKNNNPRYDRHYSLKDFGAQGQQKLAEAKILVVGAGGLGCPVLQYLAAAGVGTIGVVDDDVISISNLQRQVLYSTEDVGRAKAAVAALKLQQLNPEITIYSFKMLVNSTSALELIADYDVVIDCTDNFAARYLINDACVLLNKPLIFGAVYRYEGQVAVFNVADAEGNKANYRHLFATPPDPLEVADCNEAGVLGVLPGVIGMLQATEAIKLIAGIGEVLINRLMTFNVLTYDSFIIDITTHKSLTEYLPKDEAAFKATDYNWLCWLSAEGVKSLDNELFTNAINSADTVVIDVREIGEGPEVGFPTLNIPLSALSQKIPEINENNIILFCNSGKRSLKAGRLLFEQFGNLRKISHLEGGLIALQKYYEQAK